MGIDRSVVPFITLAWLPCLVLFWFGEFVVAIPLFLLGLFFLFFFRDPSRHPPEDEDAILAPADGRVLVAGAIQTETPPPGDWRQISIFLSPLNVHINRSPIYGLVTNVKYKPGKFFPAYRSEAASQNECNEIWLKHDRQFVVCRQIVGVMARRIVCRVEAGMRLLSGQRLGIMKFGSRIDLFVPVNATICVSEGQLVRAGETVVAKFSKVDDSDDVTTVR